MSAKTQKTLGMAGIIALCLSNLCYMSDLIILPAYSAIFGHFANDSALVTNFIASGAQLTLLIGSFGAPLLMRYFSKRNIILVGFGLFTIQATCSGLVDSAEYVAVMRGITGIFMGFVMPTALALIVEMYHDDDVKRTKYTGWFDGCLAGMGAVLMIVGGVLLTFGWDKIFWGYLLGVPIWILLFFTIPSTPPEGKKATAQAQDGAPAVSSKPMDWRKFVLIFLAFTFCNMFYGCLVYEFSFYLAENFVLPAWVNGVLGAAKGIIGAIMGIFVFAPLFKRAKRFTITVCFAAQALAFFGLAVVIPGTPGVIWFLICYSFMGIAFGLSIPYYHSYSAACFSTDRMPLVASMISVAFALGAFVSTYFVTFLQGVLGVSAYTPVLPYVGAMCAVGAILTVIVGLKDPDRKTAFENLSAFDGGKEELDEVEIAA